MFFISDMLHLQHLFLKLSLGSPVGDALSGLLLLELAAFQVGSMEKCILDIGRDLTADCFENNLCRIRVIYQSSGVLLQQYQQVLRLDLISTNTVPNASSELASSPSSLEMSMAKEKRLVGESYSCKKE